MEAPTGTDRKSLSRLLLVEEPGKGQLGKTENSSRVTSLPQSDETLPHSTNPQQRPDFRDPYSVGKVGQQAQDCPAHHAASPSLLLSEEDT